MNRAGNGGVKVSDFVDLPSPSRVEEEKKFTTPKA